MCKVSLSQVTMTALLVSFGLSAQAHGLSPSQNQSTQTSFAEGQRYSMESPSELSSWQAGESWQKLNLPAGSEFEVLEIVKDPIQGEMVRLGVDADEESGIPSDFLVPLMELKKNQIKGLPEDSFSLEYGIQNRRGGKKMTYCYRDVKKTLLRMGICRKYASGSMAWQGYQVLQRECGMVPTSYSDSLPVGAVCVSSGGRSCGSKPCGHIAVKLKANTWFGAGYTRTPWLSHTKPMGCLVAGGRRAFSSITRIAALSESSSSDKGSEDEGVEDGEFEDGDDGGFEDGEIIEDEEPIEDDWQEGDDEEVIEARPANRKGSSQIMRTAPILGPFLSKHAQCARGCSYVSWGIWGDAAHRRRPSCHNSGEAIDIHAIKCGGRTFGPHTERFRGYVSCMRTSFAVIFGNRQHRNHAHIQFHGCRKTRG